MTPVPELVDVTFRRNGKQIIDDISLTVQQGQHWAPLGPNGAGKSTLLGYPLTVREVVLTGITATTDTPARAKGTRISQRRRTCS